MHPLDRPVWASLTTHHASMSEGNALVRRFSPDVNPFASTCDDSPKAIAELATLVRPGECIYLLQVAAIVVPPGFVTLKEGKGVQMVATRPELFEASRADILTLGDTDAPQMMRLAELTEPGPFVERTHTMGTFLGIRIGGQLAAMAGERMRFPGYTEVSGVCTHPDFRSRGLAGRLSATVAAGIAARGDRPFLHAWKSNHSAISLYERLGFEVRTEVNAVALKRSDVEQ
jgi:predicted GNAT family acetyltransferase